MGEVTQRLDAEGVKAKLAVAEMREDLRQEFSEDLSRIDKLEKRFWQGLTVLLGSGFITALGFLIGLVLAWDDRGDRIEALEGYHTKHQAKKAEKSSSGFWFWQD